MKIDCDKVLNLSEQLSELSNVCYEKVEKINIEKMRIAEFFLTEEILKNLNNDKNRLEEEAQKLKRYSVALKKIVAVYTKGESSICDILENGSGRQYIFNCTLDNVFLNCLDEMKIDIPQITLKAE